MNTNRDWWDERAALHGQDRVYDTNRFLAGGSTLYELDHEVMGEVSGLEVLHLQCHTGVDTLSLLRAGARTVTGVDFPPVAVAKALATASQAAWADRATFVEADVLALPRSLHGRFDICYASRGVISWIGDLTASMQTAAATLRPGGRLVLIDLHPLFNMAASVEPLRLDLPDVNTGPRVAGVRQHVRPHLLRPPAPRASLPTRPWVGVLRGGPTGAGTPDVRDEGGSPQVLQGRWRTRVVPGGERLLVDEGPAGDGELLDTGTVGVAVGLGLGLGRRGRRRARRSPAAPRAGVHLEQSAHLVLLRAPARLASAARGDQAPACGRACERVCGMALHRGSSLVAVSGGSSFAARMALATSSTDSGAIVSSVGGSSRSWRNRSGVSAPSRSSSTSWPCSATPPTPYLLVVWTTANNLGEQRAVGREGTQQSASREAAEVSQ